MRQPWLGLGLVLGWLVWSVSISLAGSSRPYIAEGVGAIIQADQSAARTRALQGAFREALEQVVLDMAELADLAGKAQALRTRVYANPLQYVLSYRVLWEYPDPSQKVYRVGVEADIAVADVGRALDSMGLTRRKDPRQLVIFMAERYPGQTSQTFAAAGGVVAEVLRRTLQAEGLRVINLDPGRLWDGQETSALAVGKQLNAKIVLVGWAQVQSGPRESPTGRETSQARVEVKALATEGAGQIAQAQVETVAAAAEGEHSDAQALEQAAMDIAAQLAPPLLSYRAGR
jgi:hypothetical protein